MKVLLINGSPKEKGCTYTALCEVAKTLNEENIEKKHKKLMVLSLALLYIMPLLLVL